MKLLLILSTLIALIFAAGLREYQFRRNRRLAEEFHLLHAHKR